MGMNEVEGGKMEDKRVKTEQICEECKQNPSKYTCPGCSTRTCALPCVKSHKRRKGCSGQRCRTEFLPLAKFNDSTILSDYLLLEDAKRVAEAAERFKSKLCLYNSCNLPPSLSSLKKAASSRTRKTKLIFLPSGMAKREANMSRYNKRKKCISWTLEWRFHSTDVVIHDHGVNENRSFLSVLENHLKPGPWNHKLKEFCDENADSLKLFISKTPSARSAFKQLDPKGTIQQELVRVVLLEHPVVHILLPFHEPYFPVTVPCCSGPRWVPDEPDPASGRLFTVEEIEEPPSDEDGPRILDLGGSRDPTHIKAVDDPIMRPVTCDDYSATVSEFLMADFDDTRFDFDQRLIDLYSELVAEINPDDFLEPGLFGDSRSNFGSEEVEEGEIVE